MESVENELSDENGREARLERAFVAESERPRTHGGTVPTMEGRHATPPFRLRGHSVEPDLRPGPRVQDPNPRTNI